MAASECEAETVQGRPHRIGGAGLLKRVFDIDMQHCPSYSAGELKIIAAILERRVIKKILTHPGLDPQPPPQGAGARAGAVSSWLSRIRRPFRTMPSAAETVAQD